ncbi:MBL fold metallo-hydrolase [Saccharopolyspora erythraea]|uniref:MBL fold metallo-hydrolase n=1 Tax=Saccharopolyspora erythraea TaxID=1836 RepID=UPI001BA97861|nr:MBL fold metallo-hydrolase [Saccharopolyspora erythraea]QUG99680.1 MBL fold metallo-hydrolase [Saccharopolyspora erythraea]
MEHPAYGSVRPVTAYASVLLARNPDVMTLDGTNTWLVGSPDAADRIVIDPGPADRDHLELAAERPVSVVLLTHHHPDHTAGARDFAELTGAPVRALDPALCAGAEPLTDGETVEASGVRLRVLATPGHTADSVCLTVDDPAEPAVFTGDTVLGKGTTVVAHPDGHLGSYLESLRLLGDLPEGTRVLPGHGPELPDIRAISRAYLAHRSQRLGQIRTVLREHGPGITARRVVEIVYADVDPAVWPAAEWSVQAQLTYLRELEAPDGASSGPQGPSA